MLKIIASLAPYLLILVCPLMMIFMMRGMHGGHNMMRGMHGGHNMKSQDMIRQDEEIAQLKAKNEQMVKDLAELKVKRK
ncbi:DUF2933 domain-containing protein [Lactobacillus delbrueckii subsp. lactis]|uniref:DUF2933 domain-containing protein n=1 Tax=Lactobacillus delbrueckii TaxID=1584 RepID=UPI001E38B22E|nr:DUF2933 domain-containing protein [Lactobacillus delbrueckii]MCD5507328.1 DUF2933 domain-containing protein [Lactobacillus delbrueckii subsp. lactis]MCD5524414.1 DUF2933 domain-containing protein [Lactobacillus delbrueckii subsp. lactis]MCD5526313.1 DUF2933 domain-containing protein [Lactobacillus delbrueckii subsp. lactis]MCT3483759.1 DUF2933 domain-containing protein [Lactobacillus delbrueckii subsp. lactis]MCT3521077.1 DUF2933 domain-containing protein [Lactobacillus delbrueckii subsp. l